MRRAAQWSLAGGVSVLAHAALLGLVALAVDPDPAPQQNPAEARLSISAYAVDRSEAVAEPLDSVRTSEKTAQGPAATSASVPTSQAVGTQLPTMHADPVAAAGEFAAPSDPTEQALLVGATQDAGIPAATVRSEPESAREATASGPSAVLAKLRASEKIRSQEPAADSARPTEPVSQTSAAMSPEAGTAASLSLGAMSASALPAPRETVPGKLLVTEHLPARDDATAIPLRPAATVAPLATPASTQRVGQAILATAPSPLAAQPSDMAARAEVAKAGPNRAESLAEIEGLTLAAMIPVQPPEPETATVAAAVGRDAKPAAPFATVGLSPPLPSETPPSPLPGALAQAAPQSEPAATAMTAALVWSGTGSTAVDEVSLAAIQSFTQESDLAGAPAGAITARDGIAALLGAVPCSRLQTTFIPETGRLELRGHIPEDGLRGPILAALQAQVGSSIPLSDNILVLPRPTCGVLTDIAAVGLPQSNEQDSNPRVVGPDTHARIYRFQDGERLKFEMTGADYPAYFYIDYFDADGMVLHLQPNDIVPLQAIEAKQSLVVGRTSDGQPALEITVSPPFGQEIMVAFAASLPLFDGVRPVYEPAAPYLEFLRERVALVRQSNPSFKGEWVYFFVETRAR